MRSSLRLGFAICTAFALAASACKNQNKTQSASKPADTNTGSATPAPAPIPARKPGPFSATELVELSRIKFEAFRGEPVGVQDNLAVVRHYSAKPDGSDRRPATYATVRINPCQSCLPMSLEAWQKQADAIKALTLEESLRAAADTTFLLSETKVAGKTMIAGYQIGQKDMAYTHAAMLWYTDGQNEISIIMQYADNPTRDQETMAKLVSRDELEAAAAMMMNDYIKHF